jgi:hypothetical protein
MHLRLDYPHGRLGAVRLRLPVSRSDLPPRYGTLAYRIMLAANMSHGYHTAWMPDPAGYEYKLVWIRVPVPNMVPAPEEHHTLH